MACSALTMLMSVNCQHYTEPVLVPVFARETEIIMTSQRLSFP